MSERALAGAPGPASDVGAFLAAVDALLGPGEDGTLLDANPQWSAPSPPAVVLGLLTAFSALCRLECPSRLPLRRSDRRRVLAVLVSLQLVPGPPYRA